MFKALLYLVTPFKEGRVDEDKLKELVDFQIKNGTSGIVPCGLPESQQRLPLRNMDG